MILKELLQIIKLKGDDFITVKYEKRKGDFYEIRVLKHFYECDVISYKVYDTECIDPINRTKGTLKQHIILLDEDEARIVFERIRKGVK